MAGGVGWDSRLVIVLLSLIWLVIGLLLIGLKPKPNTSRLTFVRTMLASVWVLVGRLHFNCFELASY